MGILSVLQLELPRYAGTAAAAAKARLGSAAGAGPYPSPRARADSAPVAAQPAEETYFQPKLEVLDHSVMAPVMVPLGGEAGVELLISNWDDAPNDIVVTWRTSLLGVEVKASVDHGDGRALLSLQGVKISNGIVRVLIDVKTKGRTFPFEFTPIFAVVMPGETADPGEQSEDRGGTATVTDLEQDMGILMAPWLTAALSGVSQFTTNALSDEIDDMSSGSMTGFFENFLGNTMWAATCFFPAAGALKIFAVSMAGIAAAAVPSIPHASKSHIPEVQKIMNTHLFEVFGKLTPRFRSTAQAIVDKHPEVKRYEALTLFAKASLVPGAVRIDPSFKQKPKLVLQYIADTMESRATERLKNWVASEKAVKDEKDLQDTIRKTSHRQPGEM